MQYLRRKNDAETFKESIRPHQRQDLAVARASGVRLNYFFVDFSLKYKLVLCSAGEVSNWKLIVAEQTSVDGTKIVFRRSLRLNIQRLHSLAACLAAYFVIPG